MLKDQFYCNRDDFIKYKNISNAPTMEFVLDFYQKNWWRVDPFEDPGAVTCYERLYEFWIAYKEPESFPWYLLVAFFGLLLIGSQTK